MDVETLGLAEGLIERRRADRERLGDEPSQLGGAARGVGGYRDDQVSDPADAHPHLRHRRVGRHGNLGVGEPAAAVVDQHRTEHRDLGLGRDGVAAHVLEPDADSGALGEVAEHHFQELVPDQV